MSASRIDAAASEIVAASERDAASRVVALLPYLVAGCMFMENLDATVIVTALPAIATTFRVSAPSLSLAITAYLVAAAAFLPLNAWLADRVGARRLMATAIAVFTLASVGCGLAGAAMPFIALRAVQGASGALMSATGRLVVLRDAPKTRLVHTVAILTWPSLLAPVLGPPVGGLLTSYVSWHWIFYLNLPLGVVGIAAVLRWMPTRRAVAAAPLDRVGFALVASSLAALIVGLDLLGTGAAWASAGAGLVVAGLATGYAAIRWLRRAVHPIVGLGPVRFASFRISAISGGTFSRIAVGATPFLLPLMLQTVLGASAYRAGAITLVYFLGNVGMKLFTTAILRRFGFRAVLIANGAAVAAIVAMCAVAVTGLPLAWLLAILIVAGATRSLQFTALNTLAFADVAPADMGAANTLNSVVQQVAMALGVSIAAITLNLGAAAGYDRSTSFQGAFLTVAAVGAAALIFYAGLRRTAGDELAGRATGR